jgi:hypothetical protein
VRLVRGQRVDLRAVARWSNAAVGLTLWRPGAKSLHGRKWLVARVRRAWKTQHISYRAAHTGWYEVQLRIARDGGGRYALHVTKRG